MNERPLSELMQRIIVELSAADQPMTPNQIGDSLRVKPVFGGRGQGGRGKGHRAFGSAQRIIFPLNALCKRGLVYRTWRPGGRTGGAYDTTSAGDALAAELSPTSPSKSKDSGSSKKRGEQ